MADQLKFSDRIRVVSLTPNVLTLESTIAAIESLVRQGTKAAASGWRKRQPGCKPTAKRRLTTVSATG